ncbi:hypothetical protein BHE74_00027150 [Ensete ventricosum]|nr:hypothetical protein BHE74_00027150 [Ensete ventricosum]RZR93911.1 hypothetical protein BHM03_00022489 [Ensete ventricosum]
MWASTHNQTLYEKMSSLVDALYDCQKKVGTGYLSAFPPEFFDRFEAIQSVWAPYYTIHKQIMAGLLDQYVLAGNVKALQMVVGMADYFGNRVKNVILKYSIERHWTSLNEETGGMNDVLYRLYSITVDESIDEWCAKHSKRKGAWGDDLHASAGPWSVKGKELPWLKSNWKRYTRQSHFRSCSIILADDRPEYGSLQALLFGPYLLAGLTSGEWDIKTGNSSSISDWITAVPASYNGQLVSLVQEANGKTLVFSNSNGSITMEEWPAEGTNSAVHATFRVIFQDSNRLHYFLATKKTKPATAQNDAILEPFDLPGMVVAHRGPSNGLAVSTAATADSMFSVVQGLDGRQNTVSLESSSQRGCFVSGGVDYSAGTKVRLICSSNSDVAFRRAVSFTPVSGLKQYNPISFVAKGAKQNFVLEPLLSLRDETYTVYFNVGA